MTEYKLYPINNNNVDWPLYHLVAHFMKNSYHLDGITVGDGQTELFKPFDDDAVQEKRSYEYKLVFPNEELTVSYPEEILDQEVVVLKSYIPIEHMGIPNAFDPDDDGVWYQDIPLEYFCYSDNGHGPTLKHVHTDMPSAFPSFVYNGDLFAKAVASLLDFLRRHNLTEFSWYERLQTVLQMLEGNANELHILHNAGFFDHNELWNWLEDYDINKRDIVKTKDGYLAQLKRYAMFVLNHLNWEKGTPIGENDREKRVGVYQRLTEEKMAAITDEMARRMKLLQNKLEKYRTNAIERRIFALTPGSPATPVDVGKRNNRTFLIIIGAFAAMVLLVFGLVVGLGGEAARNAAVAVGGIVAIVTAGVAAAAARSYEHRHPAEFRYIMLFVGILLPFLFGWTGNVLMKALIDVVSPLALMIFVLILMTVVVVASVLLRRKQPDERHMRPYTVAIVVAVMEIIGHFVGGFIPFVE
jgi:hypothetical protein